MIKLDDPLVDHGSQGTSTLTMPSPAFESAPKSRSRRAQCDVDGFARMPRETVGLSYFSQLLSVGIPLWVADVVSVVVAYSMGLLIAWLSGLQINHPVSFIGFLSFVFSVSNFSTGLYPGLGLHPARELKTMYRSSVFVAVSVAIGLGALTNWGSPYVLAIAFGVIVQLVAMPLLRGAAKCWMLKRGIGIPVAFLGRKECVERVYRDMKRFGNPLVLAVGRFADRDADEEYSFEDSAETVPLIGSGQDLIRANQERGIHRLMVVGDEASEFLDSNPSIVSSFPEVIVTRSSRSQTCAGSSVVNYGLVSGIKLEEARLLPSARIAKRTVDIVVSSLALVLLSPLLILVAATIRLTGSGSIFFGSERVGVDGKTFKAWKFRSMVPNASEVLKNFLVNRPDLRTQWERDKKLKDDPRITLVGRLIRKTSIDELPQLWNVLVGEMSIVGPRPMLTDEINRYGNTYREYLMAKPGITGLWQICGRNNTSYQERLDYVEYYVRHWNPWMDLYILFRTIRTVLLCEGAC